MDVNICINILTNREVITKLSEALGPLIQLTIAETVKTISTCFDENITSLHESIDTLQIEYAKRGELVNKLQIENDDLQRKLRYVYSKLSEAKQYSH